MTEVKTIAVKAAESGQRLDRWLGRCLPDLSFVKIQKLIRTGQVRVDGKRAKPSDHIETGQMIRVPPVMAASKQSLKKTTHKPNAADRAKIRSWIVFEDDDVMALNKPAGVAVQGGTGIKQSLDEMLKAFDPVNPPRLVHRLDRETSGILLLAKNLKAANRLTEAFRERESRKIYWAVTVGVPKPASGRIDVSLRKSGERMIVGNGKDAKPAETDYRVLQKKNDAAFVMLWPRTGRTHQLRVHLAHGQTPILGDRFYGKTVPEEWRPMPLGKGLHLLARRLIMPHPQRGVIDVMAPLPDSLLPTWRHFGFPVDADDDF